MLDGRQGASRCGGAAIRVESACPAINQKKAIELLLSFAEGIGATRAKRLAPGDICVEEKLADLCHDPKCPFWGQSMSCPPYVTGSAGFSKLLKLCHHTIVIHLEIQTCSLQGEDRPQVMRLLHEIVAEIEKRAIQLGFTGSAGFAGGFCKPSFCHDEPYCRVIEEQGDAGTLNMHGRQCQDMALTWAN